MYLWPIVFAIAVFPIFFFFDWSRIAVALGTVVFSIAGGVVIARAAQGVERAMR